MCQRLLNFLNSMIHLIVNNTPTSQITEASKYKRSGGEEIRIREPASITKPDIVMPSFSTSTFKNPLLVLFLLVLGISFSPITFPTFALFNGNQSPQIYTIEVVNEFPHDPHAYTQGLLYAGNDSLFESTGFYGESSVRRVDLRSGKIQLLNNMDESYFGEGLTLLGERLFQVTWLTDTGFIYDQNNLSKIGEFTHQMKDGWGLATDGKVLFGSDGTSTLYQFDPRTFEVTKKNIVKYNNEEVRYLNELEFINDEIWANVYATDCIARISHRDGAVLGWILLDTLREKLIAAGYRLFDVLNGIAWDSMDNRIFVTGKLWPKLYEIKLHPVTKHVDAGVIKRTCTPQLYYHNQLHMNAGKTLQNDS